MNFYDHRDWACGESRGVNIEATGSGAAVGQRCHIFSQRRQSILEGEVIGFREQRVVVMPFGPVRGIGAGDLVRYDPSSPRLLSGNIC